MADTDILCLPSRRKVSLSDEQSRALDQVERFIDDPSRGDTFVLQGLAGSGKTTVLAEVAHRHPGALMVTFTGKAASVLAAKTGLQVLTIHQAIYRLRETSTLPNGKMDMRWDLAKSEGDFEQQIVLLDESSMVGQQIARDLLRTGARIIACGDPGQLPPVKDNPFFVRPDFVLREIHRQALDSPIIRQAHNVRHHGRYEADGEDFRLVRHIDADALLAADVVLCWKNISRMQLNHLKRAHLGIAHRPPQKNEPVMCLMNQRELGLFNGAVYRLAEDYHPGSNRIVIDADGARVRINGTFFEGLDDAGRQWTREVTPFCYGYAMTAHKSQGSEWPSVIVYDEYERTEGYREWMYTALTRAQQRIIVNRPWGWA